MTQNRDQMEIWVENVNQIFAALEASDVGDALIWADHLRTDLTSHLAAVKEPV